MPLTGGHIGGRVPGVPSTSTPEGWFYYYLFNAATNLKADDINTGPSSIYEDYHKQPQGWNPFNWTLWNNPVAIYNYNNLRTGNFTTGPSAVYEQYNKSKPSGGNNMPKYTKDKRRGSSKSNDRRSGKYGGSGSGGGGSRGSGGSGGSGSGYDDSKSSGSSNPIQSSGTNWLLDQSDDKQISVLNTGIRSGLTSLTVQPSELNKYSPLYVQSGYLDVTGTTNSYVREIVTRLCYPQYLQYLQRNLNWQVTLTEADFLDYFHNVVDALQMYYTVESTIAYVSNPSSSNLSLEQMRAQLTPDIMEALTNLSSRIQQMVIPPEIFNFVYWYYQLYSANTLPGAPILKHSFKGMYQGNAATTGGNAYINAQLIEDEVDVLFGIATSGIGAKIAQVFPQWRITLQPS